MIGPLRITAVSTGPTAGLVSAFHPSPIPREVAGEPRVHISERVATTRAGGPVAINETDGNWSLARRESKFRFALAAADALAAIMATTVAIAILGDDRLTAFMLLAAPVVVLASKIVGLYDRDELLIHKTTLDEAPMLFQVATVFTLVVVLLQSVFVRGTLGMEQIAGLWALLFVFSLGGRYCARRLAESTSPTERILVVGDATSCERIRFKLTTHHKRAEVVGRLSMQDWAKVATATDMELLRDVVRDLDVYRVVIVPSPTERDATLELIRAAKSIGVRVSLLPDVLEVVGSSVVFDDLYGLPVLGVRRFGLTRSSKLLKRAFDLTGAVLGLVVFGPLMLAIAVAIRLDSPGPVFFHQERVGRDGRVFRIFKFRSMIADAEQRKAQLGERNDGAEGFFKIDGDPRITRVGRFLRSTALDELPQLLNVVLGQMSLVGPRPLILAEDRMISGNDRRRLSLTPGMTGHWQILGSSRLPLAEMVKIDYLYVAGWSLWADVKLIARTVPYMLARRGR